MKKKAFLFITAGLLILVSCNDSQKKMETVKHSVKTENTVYEDADDNSKNSLDYAGKYEGNLPSASGGGMKVSIVLTNKSFEKTTSYDKAPNDLEKKSGKISWDKTGSIITLEGEDAPNKYLVGENKLIQLDMEGKEITGNLADKYILVKK